MSMRSFRRPPVSQQAWDWVVSAVDPFHDIDHPIEGAPDKAVSKSITRKWTQTATVSATADDDNITLFFFGSHGAYDHDFQYWGDDGNCDGANGSNPRVTLAPISVLRGGTGTEVSLANLIGGYCGVMEKLYTCSEGGIPSRLVSLGVEVTDVTPSLYRKGTVGVAHANGEVEKGAYRYADYSTATGHMTFYRKPMCPTVLTQTTAIVGSYVGAMAKGVYTQARLNEIQAPSSGSLVYPNITVAGAHGAQPLLAEPGANESAYLLCPVSGNASTMSWANIDAAKGWSDSGFCPFSIVMTGLSEETVLQVTVKTTTEYFPQLTHLMECGFATYSPPYEPRAFQVYHEIMRSLPAAVPVGMNASGDYWRMAMAVYDRVVREIARYGPGVGEAIAAAATAAGAPNVALVGGAIRAVGRAARRARGEPAGSKKGRAKAQP
jgi:hypothetical protein